MHDPICLMLTCQAPITYDDETYKSESATADRNWCLGYMMKESNAFPPCFAEQGLEETLELYFQTCSIESTSDAMATMSATLANGGFCPLTGEKVSRTVPLTIIDALRTYNPKSHNL